MTPKEDFVVVVVVGGIMVTNARKWERRRNKKETKQKQKKQNHSNKKIEFQESKTVTTFFATGKQQAKAEGKAEGGGEGNKINKSIRERHLPCVCVFGKNIRRRPNIINTNGNRERDRKRGGGCNENQKKKKKTAPFIKRQQTSMQTTQYNTKKRNGKRDVHSNNIIWTSFFLSFVTCMVFFFFLGCCFCRCHSWGAATPT